MTIEKYLPKVLEFFLRSTTTSRILPWVTVIIFACDLWVCICKPLKTFFFEYDITSNRNESIVSLQRSGHHYKKCKKWNRIVCRGERTANDVDGLKAFYKVQPLPQCSSAQGQHR